MAVSWKSIFRMFYSLMCSVHTSNECKHFNCLRRRWRRRRPKQQYIVSLNIHKPNALKMPWHMEWENAPYSADLVSNFDVQMQLMQTILSTWNENEIVNTMGRVKHTRPFVSMNITIKKHVCTWTPLSIWMQERMDVVFALHPSIYRWNSKCYSAEFAMVASYELNDRHKTTESN